MEILDEQFFINTQSLEIWSRTVWCRRYVKDLNHTEVASIILNDSPDIFINAERDKLSRVPDDERLSFWESDLKGHIAKCEDDLDLTDFENGYCYAVQLWKGKGGQKILVLRYHH
jgi:hypothetical protein